MPTITVTQGGPDIEPGAYNVYLEKLEGPKRITARQGPNAGQDVDVYDWLFIVEGSTYDGTEIQASSSTASGPRSKMYAWLTALFEGKPPQVGTSFDTNDLVGLRAIATIAKDESGWPRIVSLGAMPTAKPAAAPVAAGAAPARRTPPPRPGAAVAASEAPVAVAENPSNLPF